MKKQGLLLAIVIVISACGKKSPPDNTPNLTEWNRSTIASRTVDGKPSDTVYVMECRKGTDAKNVYYYYSVFADRNTSSTYTDKDGVKTLSFPNPEFEIQRQTINYTNTSHSRLGKPITQVSVDFSIVIAPDGSKTFTVKANDKTALSSQDFYRIRTGSSLYKAGEEIMKMNFIKGKFTNLTERMLPGDLSKYEELECR